MNTISAPSDSLFAPPSPAEKRTLHHEQLDQAEALADPDAAGRRRQAEAARVRRELVRYLTALGIGTRFQAIDFTSWLANQGLMPDKDIYDGRAVGGLFVALSRAKLIDPIGYQPDGGCAQRNCNSTTRPLYVVRSLDFSQLGWEEARRAG